MSSTSLRYFNAGVIDPNIEIGELHSPETHLIPLVIEAAFRGNSAPFTIQGSDYQTTDGTCIRDFVHVCDVGAAHVQVLQKILNSDKICDVINLGAGKGYSVMDIIKAVE